MSEALADPFDGFCIADPRWWGFDLAVRDLNINRHWSSSGLGGQGAEFATSISGQAVSERNEAFSEREEVWVIETDLRSGTFHLTLRSDTRAFETWQGIKNTELLVGHDASHPERLRIRNIQYEKFDRTSPTATLWYDHGWLLECQVPSVVLMQLSEDLVASRVERVGLQIKWIFPLRLKKNWLSPWGFFDGSQLRGHVDRLHWTLPVPEPKARTVIDDEARPASDDHEPLPDHHTRPSRSRFFKRNDR